EEHIKDQLCVLVAVQKQAVGHGELVKIHHHGGVIIVLVGNIRDHFDFIFHRAFPSCPLKTSFLVQPRPDQRGGQRRISVMIASFGPRRKFFLQNSGQNPVTCHDSSLV